MPFKNKDDALCGYLDWLNSSNLDIKVRRFVIIKHGTPSKLELYFEKVNKESLERNIDVVIDLSQTSMVIKYEGDIATSENIFYIIYDGDPMYFAAENTNDRDGWCNVISSELLHSGPTTPMSLSEDMPSLLREKNTKQKSNSRFYIPLPNSNDNHIPIPEHGINDFCNSHVFKTGICNKKDGYQSAWNERYFVLNIDGLFYFKCHYDPCLLGFIRYQDIVTCRESKGVFPHLINIFEVVTRGKVYYFQTDTTDVLDDWISVINSNNDHAVRLSLTSQISFDDDIIVYDI